MTHPTNDLLLNVLSEQTGSIGSLACSFPGTESLQENPTWLDDWFRSEIERNLVKAVDPHSDSFKFTDDVQRSIDARSAPVGLPVTLSSIRPNYFRGFRKINSPIDFAGNLVIVDGRNSSGKTSLTESIEWLLTGQLQRRLRQDQGNPAELENFIQSQFRPADEETIVEAILTQSDGTKIQIKRILENDYSSTSTSRCTSTFYVDEVEQTPEQEIDFFERHFASVPPLLMQHTLREFIHKNPNGRSEYFEKLLQLNELTTLIDRAVIGDPQLDRFRSATGSLQKQALVLLINDLGTQGAKKALRDLTKTPSDDHAKKALVAVAKLELDCVPDELGEIDEAVALVQKAQEKQHIARFPMLGQLRPTRSLDLASQEQLKGEEIRTSLNAFEEAIKSRKLANEAANQFNRVEAILAPAIQDLVNERLILPDPLEQDCPLCETSNALTSPRLKKVLSSEPIAKAQEVASSRLRDARVNLVTSISRISALCSSLIPELPDQKICDAEIKRLSPDLRSVAEVEFANLRSIANDLTQLRNTLKEVPGSVVGALQDGNVERALKPSIVEMLEKINSVPVLAMNVRSIVGRLDEAVRVEARQAAEYALREKWLKIATSTKELVSDLLWDVAAHQAQKNLEAVRSAIIQFRQDALESRRLNLSDGIGEIWGVLRSDRYSCFRNLSIPAPKGKGFPVTIQVRATIDDGQNEIDVDALRIFSESQTNVLGIAAFIVRAQLTGQGFVVLDDPVQSMDEEHFDTLAKDLIPKLLEMGLQVIVFTHNDTFARAISWTHAERENYVTMKARHSRRVGCAIEVGNRRISERLKMAENLADEEKIEEGWVKIRLAIERLYTLVKIKNDAGFKADTWANHAAENMWEEGVGEIIEKAIPESGKKLRDILTKTAAGAHDKGAKGATDLNNAAKYIKSLITPLRIGD